MRTPPLAAGAAAFLLAAGASAQEPSFFADKSFVWKAEAKDVRLPSTRIYKALSEEPKNPACGRVAATLLMAFSESAPYFHKRDNAFVMFQSVVAPITTPNFPANEFLLHLLRRAMIDKQVPEAWLETGRKLKARYGVPIDLARLAYAVDGPVLVDSVYFGLNSFIDRYQAEVELATSLGRGEAADAFETRYLGHTVAWGGLMLADVHKEEAPKPKGKRGKAAPPPEEPPAYLATLIVPLPPAPPLDPLFPKPKPEPIRVVATLLPDQYIDVKAAMRSGTYLVHGRLWSFERGSGVNGSPPFTFQIRDALLFQDRDLSGFPGVASARDVAACELCVNDLSPFGLKEHQGIGSTDGFAH